jgi:hypothetical protein
MTALCLTLVLFVMSPPFPGAGARFKVWKWHAAKAAQESPPGGWEHSDLPIPRR